MGVGAAGDSVGREGREVLVGPSSTVLGVKVEEMLGGISLDPAQAARSVDRRRIARKLESDLGHNI